MRIATILLTTILLVGSSVRADFKPVVCEGDYAQHLQGVCTDEKEASYWSFTTKLVKTDRDGKLVKQIDVASHHGDLCFYEGKVYVAVNLGKFNDPEGKADSWVYVYNADDLSFLTKHKTAEVFHGAGGIAFHEGKFFVVGGLPTEVKENYVYEYDGKFQFVKKHVLNSGHTHLGIQTAAFADGHFWFGCYAVPKTATTPAGPSILLKGDASLKKVERFEFDCSLGIVPIAPGKFLIARGGSVKDKGRTGRLVLAVPDSKSGLKLVEK